MSATTTAAVPARRSSLFKLLSSTELENTGSTARDHCANERTFLAWLRTSLTLVSFGIALAQFFQLPSGGSGGGGGTGASPEGSEQSSIAAAFPFQAFSRPHPHPRTSVSTSLAKPLGSSFVALGILALLFGAKRYFAVQEQLIRGRFETAHSEGESVSERRVVSVACALFLVDSTITLSRSLLLVNPLQRSSSSYWSFLFSSSSWVSFSARPVYKGQTCTSSTRLVKYISSIESTSQRVRSRKSNIHSHRSTRTANVVAEFVGSRERSRE